MDYNYDGTCVRVIDGDTVVLRLAKTFTQDVDFGFYVRDTMSLTKTAEVTFRLIGINAPEIEGAQKPRGLVSKAALEALIVGKALQVVSHKTDKYGRWLADIYLPGDTVSVSQKMIAGGFALPWDGNGAKPV